MAVSTPTLPAFRRMLPWIDATQPPYNARGDGTTDDTAALQSAINAAAAADTVCMVPAGIYRVTSTISLPSNTHIRGAGRYSTRFRPDAALLSYVFRAEGTSGSRLSNITLESFMLDGTNRGAQFDDMDDYIANRSNDGFARVLFSFVDNVTCRDIYGFQTDGLLVFRGTTQHFISQIECDDCYEGAIAFLADCTDGTISDVILRDCGEALDFTWGCKRFRVSNFFAKAKYLDDEGIDMESLEDSEFSNVTLKGYNIGILGKCIEGFPYQRVSFVNCHILDFVTYGFRLATFNDPGAGVELSITGCVIHSTESGAVGINAGPHQNYSRGDGLMIRDNRISTDGRCIDVTRWDNVVIEANRLICAAIGVRVSIATTVRIAANRVIASPSSSADAGIYCIDADDPVIEANDVTCDTAYGMRVRNTARPVVRGNMIRRAGQHGIYVDWNTDSFLDATNNLIGAVVDGNVIRNWGWVASGTSPGFRQGLGFNVGGVTGTWSGASVSGNRLYLDDQITPNSHQGIVFGKGTADAIDYVKFDNNLIHRVSAPTSGTVNLGANSTQENNTTSTP